MQNCQTVFKRLAEISNGKGRVYDMNSKNEVFGKYKDETGEAYYCPISKIADNTIVSEWEIDNCVEASTAERYSGNLNVVNQNATRER